MIFLLVSMAFFCLFDHSELIVSISFTYESLQPSAVYPKSGVTQTAYGGVTQTEVCGVTQTTFGANGEAVL